METIAGSGNFYFHGSHFSKQKSFILMETIARSGSHYF